MADSYQNGEYATSSHNTKALRVEKDALRAQDYPPEAVERLVDTFLHLERFKHLAGKDNVFLPAPSTSRTNIIPVVLCQRLRAAYGGEIVVTWAQTLNEVKAANKGGISKLRDPVRVAPGPRFDQLTPGRNYILVDDVVTTGQTTDALRDLLRTRGIQVASILSLGQSELRLASARDLERITQKLGEPPLAREVQAVFAGKLKHYANYIEREIRPGTRTELRSHLVDTARRIADAGAVQPRAVGSLPLGGEVAARLQPGPLPQAEFPGRDPRPVERLPRGTNERLLAGEGNRRSSLRPMAEEIRRNDYAEADRMRVQDEVARAVETNPDRFLAEYRAHPESFGGRYICADLFKETFPQYAQSKEARNRFNNPVHNSAAVLAAEQFRRTIADRSHPERDTLIFLTGSPGAGKTSTILNAGELAPNAKAVFEGQLVNPETTNAKIQQAIDAGLKPLIIVAHPRPENALENTFTRFNEHGRGASVHTMATIQGGLPDGLAAVKERFGDAVELQIFDYRDRLNPRILVGWQHLETLRSEGNYEQIKHRLSAALEQRHSANTITEACYRQARGAAPLGPAIGPDSGVVAEGAGRYEAHGHRPGAPGSHRETNFLSGGEERPSPPTNMQAGTQGQLGSQPATVRFAERDCTISADPPRGSAPLTFRLRDVQTGEAVAKITTDAAQRAPAPGCIHVPNHGEHTGLADALARSGALEPRRQMLGGMVVEMKVADPALQPHVERHEQAKAQAREAKPGKTLRREGPTLERD